MRSGDTEEEVVVVGDFVCVLSLDVDAVTGFTVDMRALPIEARLLSLEGHADFDLAVIAALRRRSDAALCASIF